MTTNFARRLGDSRLLSLPSVRNKQKAGIALAILVLFAALMLSGQQHQILSPSKDKPVSLSEGDAIRPQMVVSSPVSALSSSQPLVASFTFSPPSPVAGRLVTFNATVSGGTGPYMYSWNFSDGSAKGNGNPVAHTYAVAGAFTATLNVTDPTGTISTIQSIEVKPFNSPPQPAFTWTPPVLFAGETVFFDGSATSDPDGVVVSYSWDLGDGRFQTGVLAVLHAYSSPGTYCITLSVTDDSGDFRAIPHCVWIQPPLILALSSNVTQGSAPVFIAFNAQISGGQSPYTFSWEFGDGQVSTRQSPVHNYTLPKAYRVDVTVRDSLGHTASGEMTVTVSIRQVEPAFLGVSDTTLKIGGTLTAMSVVPLMIYVLVRRRK